MAVFRVERPRITRYEQFHLRDKRPFEGIKGLLSQMLSLPDDWIIRSQDSAISIE